MTKREIRSLIRNLLPKIDKTNKYHDLVIDSACDTVLSTMVQDYFNRVSSNVDKFIKRYGDATAITVSTDAITDIDYSTLPVGFIPLPDKASGVRRIYTVQAGGIMFYPMDAREMDLAYSNSNFYLLSNKIGYLVLPTKIEYFGMTDAIKNAGVRMDIVTRYRDYLDTDTVLLPGDMTIDNEKSPFIMAVLRVLGIIQPADLKDDNKDNFATNKQQQ